MTRRQDVITPTVAEPGTIRGFWRGLAGYVGATPAFSWTANGFAANAPIRGPVTNSLRYLITTRNVLTAGNQRSNPIQRPPIVRQAQAPPVPLVYAGNIQGRPTIRARIISFGSRIPAVNRVRH